MFIEQLYLESLGHASYVVGSKEAGEALVLDPRRDVDVYFDVARAHDTRIAYVVDTHGHNDYLSGRTEIAARAPDGRILADLDDGHAFEIGDVRVEVMHTPGHTPEHISLVLYDLEASSDEPAMLLSGGALLVGDLARPDLLGGDDAAREAARTFCHVLQEKVLTLPDHVQVFPTHVAGSLCGGSIGSRLSTTIGYERRTNVILSRVSSSEEFVDECIRLDDLPAVPPYWRRMRAQNMAGPDPLGVLVPPPALTPEDLERRMGDGAIVLDARPPEAFAGGHVPRALNVGNSSSFPTWAGTVLTDDDADVLLVVDRPADVAEITWHLLRIGYRTPIGWLAGGMRAWRTSGRDLAFTESITVRELADRLDDVTVLDVRQPAEWTKGHIPGALHITGAELPDRLDEVPRGETVAVICSSGYRSSVAVSLLARKGHGALMNVLGGMSAWEGSDLPTTS